MNQTDNFEMSNYGKESTFASFLPGISGIRGIPIWCYYVNRGQCVVSFGVDNKDHAIMEFYPAHTNGTYLESFSDESISHKMSIAMNGLTLEEDNTEEGLKTVVDYFTLPGENLGALVRKVTVTNTGSETIDLEILDGMPAVIPYGVGMESMKNMAQTTKAWMQVEDVEEKRPYYRVRVSMNDSADVKKVEGGNFSIGCLENGEMLQPIVDPDVVFAYDCSLETAVNFKENGSFSEADYYEPASKQLLWDEEDAECRRVCSYL